MCADICACQDKKCPSRTLCYRYTCEKNTYRQAYFLKSPRKKGKMRCDEFWSNEGTPDPTDYSVSQNKNRICDCNLYGMKHKRNESCDVFEAITVPKMGTNVPKIQPKVCKRRKKWTLKQIKTAFKKWKTQRANDVFYDIEYYLEEIHQSQGRGGK